MKNEFQVIQWSFNTDNGFNSERIVLEGTEQQCNDRVKWILANLPPDVDAMVIKATDPFPLALR
jgi:hypothetical protein